MKKRTLCLLLAGLMTASLLSGCGDKTANQPNTPDTSPDDTAGWDENVPDDGSIPNNMPDDWDAPPEDDLPFPRDPRWDELQPGETAVQYYDIFIKSGMTVGEAVEAMESSDIYHEQFITWKADNNIYGNLDNGLKCRAPKKISMKTSDGTEVVVEQGLHTSYSYISIKSSDKVIMTLLFLTDIPGENDTVYQVRDLPILMVSTASYGEDSALTFMGLNGDVWNMGRQDVENLLDTAFKVRNPNTEMVQERETIDGKGFYTYRFYSSLPLSISWNGYSLWSCPQEFEGEPFKGVVTVSRFRIRADTDRPDSRISSHIDYGTAGELYWAADDAG